MYGYVNIVVPMVSWACHVHYMRAIYITLHYIDCQYYSEILLASNDAHNCDKRPWGSMCNIINMYILK